MYSYPYKWDEITENHWRKNPTRLSTELFDWFNSVNRILDKQSDTIDKLLKIYGRDDEYATHTYNLRTRQFCFDRCGPYCYNTLWFYLLNTNRRDNYFGMSNQGNPMERFEEQRRKERQRQMHDAVQKPLMDEIARQKDYKGKSAPITSLVLLLQALAQEDCSAQFKRIATALEEQNKRVSGKPNGNSGNKSGESTDNANGSGGDQILEWLDKIAGGSSGNGGSGSSWYESLDVDEQSLAFLGRIIEKTKETIDIWNPWSYGIQNLIGLDVARGTFPAMNIKKIMKLAKIARKYKPIIDKILPIVQEHLPQIASSFSAAPKTSDSASLSEHFPEIGSMFTNLHVALNEPTIVRYADCLTNDQKLDLDFDGTAKRSDIRDDTLSTDYVEPELAN